VAALLATSGDWEVSVGSGTAVFCCSSTGGGSKGVTLAVEELCGTELDRDEPGTRLGRPSEAGFAAEGMGGLEWMEPDPDLCDSGTFVRAPKGVAVLERRETV